MCCASNSLPVTFLDGIAAEKGYREGVKSTAAALSTGGCEGQRAAGAPYPSSAWHPRDYQ